jgi:preprotein translocase subunit YajC
VARIQPAVGDQLILRGGYVGEVESIHDLGVMVKVSSGSLVLAKWGERVQQGVAFGLLAR